MKRIVLSVTNDLVTDHRVHKVSTTLHKAGYRVLLVGRRFRNSPDLRREYETHRMRLFFNKTGLFYAEYNLRLFFFLLFVKADIFLSNDTDTLPANYLASKLRKKALVFDAHEMFPEVPELSHRPFVRSCWEKIEDWIIPHLKNCYTVCESIATIYNERYGINMRVVRNIPWASSDATHHIVLHQDGKKVLLYQGAVNTGRGVEWMIEAMPYLEDCLFYIAGKGDLLPVVQQKIHEMKLEDRVILLGQIPLENLSSYTQAADIGISLLANQGLNYYYSLPNRIFDFIKAEVPVLATDFPEINKIVSEYQIGTLTQEHDPVHLATLIKKMLKEEVNTEGFKRAKRELTWENEEKILLKVIENLQ